ncbi:hypothetical protein B0H14DRAFT_3475710 [Mycena olivaceomarginata]|nr:hypothetical protein B0H14DRAFT_3475710 [Mycena olivaceomarginata]
MDLEHAFNSLKLTPDLTFFHPRKGFEDKRGSESFDFYVVTRGRVPGIYTHWEDASTQLAATQAWDAARRPDATPSPSPTTPVTSRVRAAQANKQSSASAPPTPGGSRRLLRQGSSAVRRGLADANFRKLEVTSRVSDALRHATDSALEVYNISDIETD